MFDDSIDVQSVLQTSAAIIVVIRRERRKDKETMYQICENTLALDEGEREK